MLAIGPIGSEIAVSTFAPLRFADLVHAANVPLQDETAFVDLSTVRAHELRDK